MIKRIKIENFRSFVNAEAELQPFTLVIGANGAGKSNLLRWFVQISSRSASRSKTSVGPRFLYSHKYQRHALHLNASASLEVEWKDGLKVFGDEAGLQSELPWAGDRSLPLFNLNPDAIAKEEKVVPSPLVAADGSGTVQVLDLLKNGDREDLFIKIEENFRRYVAEVEKLSLLSTGEGKKVIQVRETGLGGKTLPASELSEGTRLILCILTIIHQQTPPPVILLEDIDRGMHPRLFEYVAPLMQDIAIKHGINIIATTHNPYLVDAFQDTKESVLMVEKAGGASVLVPLADRLRELDYEEVKLEMPLGHLWYSGLIGGVPLGSSK